MAGGYWLDSAVFHRLEIEARGEKLSLWLDGQRVTFDQGGARRQTVTIPAAREHPRIGANQGAAGVVFSAEANRGAIGGQRARNLHIAPLWNRLIPVPECGRSLQDALTIRLAALQTGPDAMVCPSHPKKVNRMHARMRCYY